jgi:hypothetical protein
MEALQIEKNKVLEAYNRASDDGKKLLEELLGDQLVLSITDKVKSFEDACKILGIDPEDVLHAAHSDFLQKHIVSINAYSKLIVITAALNQGWEPDWDDDEENKYYSWWYMSKGGFRLNFVYYLNALSNVGSRLCYKSRELAQYAATQFEDLYKDLMIL